MGVLKIDYIQKFLGTIKDFDVKIAVLCFDRGFYSKDVFSSLQKENVPLICPVRNMARLSREYFGAIIAVMHNIR